MARTCCRLLVRLDERLANHDPQLHHQLRQLSDQGHGGGLHHSRRGEETEGGEKGWGTQNGLSVFFAHRNAQRHFPPSLIAVDVARSLGDDALWRRCPVAL